MFVITSGIGFLLAVMKGCYKSKCKQVDCCCIKITRDVAGEEMLDEISMKNKSKDEKENDSV